VKRQAAVAETHAEDKPVVPAAFVDSLDLEPAVKAGLAFCEAHGKSPEGWAKSAREARRLAWRVALCGGTTEHWSRELGQVAAGLAEAERRLARAKAQARPELAANLEAQLGSLKQRAGLLRALTEAAGPAAIDNQATRRTVLVEARRALDSVTTEVNGYRGRGVPPEVVGRYEAAQDAEAASAAAFDAGAQELVRLSDELEEARAAARRALGHAVVEVIQGLGLEAARPILDRVEVYGSYPGRIPDEVVALYESAMGAAAIALQLGEPDGQRSFWSGIGQDAGVLLEIRVGVFVQDAWFKRIRKIGGKASDNRVRQGTSMKELREVS
jgi:hypothetical protein